MTEFYLDTKQPNPTTGDLGTTPDREEGIGVQFFYETDEESLNAAQEINPTVKEETENFPITKKRLSKPEKSVEAEHTDFFTGIESLGDAFDRGKTMHELGEAGSKLRSRPKSLEAQFRVDRLESKMKDLQFDPKENTFVEWAGSAMEILGQQVESLASQEAVVLVGGGAVGGALLGLAGGPVAPATSTAGAIAGGSAGLISHILLDAYEIEGGLAYIELRNEGIEEETSALLSHGVGVLNSGLELAAATVVLKPFSEASKKLLKTGMRKAIRNPIVTGVAAKAIKAYGAGIMAEVSTEALQEVVNITADRIGKELSEEELQQLSPEEIEERIIGVAVKTFQGMVFLAAPGPGFNAMVQTREAWKTDKNKKALEDIKDVAEQSTLPPGPLSEHIADVMVDKDIQDVFISGESLANWINEQENAEDLVSDLGVEFELDEAVKLGGNVKIPSRRFAEHMLLNENFSSIADDISTDIDGMTPNEAEEFAKSGIQAEIEEVELEPLSEEQIEFPEVDIAVSQMGMDGFFKTASEAGFTPQQWEKYQLELEANKEEGKRRIADRKLKQQDREAKKEFKEEVEKQKDVASATLSQEPVYQVFNSIGKDRLNFQATKELLEEMGMNLDLLPRQKRNRKIYGSAKEKGLDPHQVAELYGYEDARDMLVELVNAEQFDSAVEKEATNVAKSKHSDLLDKRQAILAARAELHNDKSASLLQTEINAMREAKGQKKLSQKLLKQAAKEQLNKYSVRNINPIKFMANAEKLARKAGASLRKGDVSAAAQFKFQQGLNFHMAKEAIKMTKRIQKQKQKLSQFANPKKEFPTIQSPDLRAIRQLLDHVRFTPKLSEAKLDDAIEAARRKVDPVFAEQILLDEQAKIDYRDMTLNEFTNLFNTIKEIEYKSKKATKLRLKTEKRELDIIAAFIIDGVVENLRPTNYEKQVGESLSNQRKFWDSMRRFGDQAVQSLFNADTILREMDGFENLGVSYENLKGRYDRAMSEGYEPGSKGYLRRQREEAVKTSALFKVFSRKEQKTFHDKIQIPGMDRPMTRNTMLSVLLNMGNLENINALEESATITSDEMKAVLDFASEKDLDFVQSVWDYLGTYFPEVRKKEENRRNYSPEEVRAEPFVKTFEDGRTKEYAGGYYPIRYDRRQSVMNKDLLTAQNWSDLKDEIHRGNWITAHTSRGHTLARKDGRGNKILLDMYVFSSHVDQVIYDLETGDALSDIAKILNDRDVKKAFDDNGATHKWEQLDLWHRDAVTDEIAPSHGIERGLRWIRAGFTASKLGWNAGTIALQPLGIIQASAIVGKKNIAHGVWTVMFNEKGWTGEDSIFKFVQSQTGFMEAREDTAIKDVLDAETALKNHFLDKITPGNSAEFYRKSLFFFIRKAQKWADTVVWIGAKQQAMQDLGMTEQKSRRHADRMVARTQASGIFAERTPLERGSIDRGKRQTEFVRALTPLISFFMAKTNVMTERTKVFSRAINDGNRGGVQATRPFKTALNMAKHPLKTFDYVSDFWLVYVFEAAIAGLIRGQWPDEDDDETFISYVAKESANNMIAGVPGLREGVAAAQGFPPGGTIGGIAAEFGKVAQQVNQGEIDEALLKGANNMLGFAIKHPASQINKTASSVAKVLEGEDVSAIEYLMGPHFDR